MKKFIAGLLLLSMSGITIAQGITPTQKKIQDELLAKSKRQKTTGFIMLIGGAAAVAGGTAIFANNFELFTETTNSGEAGGIILATAGGAAMIGSIFLFSASARNKREANSISLNFKMEKGLEAFVQNRKTNYFPALAIKLTIR